ncbi:SdpI family protein [Brevundimonas vesicularis]|uniref:SdpI family protein n=1 Tax=Brevundimonas vesicularis TaxID=41276 RepID=UPI0038D40BB3
MNKELVNSLAWGIGILILALIASTARARGLIDQETTTRIVLGATGLMVVAFGNRIPKTFASSEAARKSKRVAGWSMVISGLIYAAAFAFAPLQVAIWLGCGAVAIGIATTVLYCARRGRDRVLF